MPVPSAILRTATLPAATLARTATLQSAIWWNLDADYAGVLYDSQQRFCAGTGACAPAGFCGWQVWDLQIPCTRDTYAKYLFQIDRFIWAQGELRRLLAAQPGTLREGLSPANVEANAKSIQANYKAWAEWCWNVARVASVMRWSTNMRWEFLSHTLETRRLAVAAEAVAYDNGDQRGARGLQDGEAGAQALSGSSIFEFNQQLWRFSQIRRFGSSDKERPTTPFPRAMHVPTMIDFEPMIGRGAFWNSDASYVGKDGEYTAYTQTGEPVVRTIPDYWGYLNFPRSSAANAPRAFTDAYFAMSPPVIPATADAKWSTTHQLDRVALVANSGRVSHLGPAMARINAAQGAQWQNLVWVVPYGHAGGVQPSKAVPSPLLTVRTLQALAIDLTSTTYGAIIEKGINGWLAALSRLPEEVQPLNSSQSAELSRAVAQSKIDEAVAAYSAAAGGVTAVVSAINPIAGVVVGIVTALAGLVMRFALELGIMFPTAPPCPPPPFIRMIGVATGGTCDLSGEAAEGRAQLARRAVMIRDLAKLNIRPEQWHDTIEAAENTALGGPVTNTNRSKLLGVSVGVAAGLLATKFFIGV